MITKRIFDQEETLVVDLSSQVRKLSSKQNAIREIARTANAEVRWVPVHLSIRRNEEADMEARSALQILYLRDVGPRNKTLALFCRLMYQH